MKFKLISILIFQLLFFEVTAQQKTEVSKIKVVYKMFLSFNKSAPINKALFFANDSYALFSYHSFANDTIKTKKTKDLGGQKINIVIPDTTTKTILTKKKEGFLYSLQHNSMRKEAYYVKEPFRNLPWVLGKEKKEIQGITCYDAHVSFRGRFYKAWYAPSIPTGFGPWKLHGLPGLILEAQDAYQKVVFKAIKIKYGHFKFNIGLKPNYKIISLKKDIKLRQKDVAKLKGRLQSRLGRDFNSKIEVSVKKLNSIELNFDDIEEKTNKN